MNIDELIKDIEGKRIQERYVIKKQIGEKSSFKKVFMAQDEKFNKEVVVMFFNDVPTGGSVLKTSGRYKAYASMVSEAKTTAALDQRFAPTIIDMFEYKEIPTLVEEYIKGVELSRIVPVYPFIDSNVVINLGLDLSYALVIEHMRGNMHKDIKADNIMVHSVGDFATAKLIDYAVWGSSATTILTRPPEVIQGQEYDEVSEVFALGSVLYYMINKFYPHHQGLDRDKDRDIVKERRIKEIPVPLKKITYSGRLEETIMKSLSRDRKDRHRSMLELNVELGKIRNSLFRKHRNEFNIGNNLKRQLERLAYYTDHILQGESPEKVLTDMAKQRRKERMQKIGLIAGMSILVYLGAHPYLQKLEKMAERRTKAYNIASDFEVRGDAVCMEALLIQDPYERYKKLYQSFQLYKRSEVADIRYVNHIKRFVRIRDAIKECSEQLEGKQKQETVERYSEARDYIKDLVKELNKELKRDYTKPGI